MTMLDKYEEGDVIEPDEWRNPEEQAFNHQSLVMSAMKKCLELGSKELREGWWDEKLDKYGNVIRAYHEDTRKSFIESVRSLMMVVNCDFDDVAKTNINNLIERIKERKEYWLNEEWRWWCSLKPQEKEYFLRMGKNVVKGFFNKKNDFDNYFFEEELNLYREICTEINNLTYRLDFYGAVGYEG